MLSTSNKPPRITCLTSALSTPCLLNDADSLLASSEEDFFQKQVAAAARLATSEEATACAGSGPSASSADGRVVLKCVVVGDHGVGKTTLLSRYVLNEFVEEHKPTVLDNYTVQLAVDGKPLQLSILDTAGLIDFSSIRQLSYNQVGIFLLCFSVIQPQSLHNILEIWLPEVRKHCPNAPILLVGTQCDLRSDLNVFRQLMEREEQPVWPEKGRKWVKVLKLAGYLECSAKTGKGLKEVFDAAIWNGLKRHKQTAGKTSSSEKDRRFSIERRLSGSLSDDESRPVTCIGPVGGSASSRQRNAARLVSSATTSSSESGSSVFSGSSCDSAPGRTGFRGGSGMVRKLAKIFTKSSYSINQP